MDDASMGPLAEPSLLVLNTGRGTQQVCDYQQEQRLLAAARAERDTARARIAELEADDIESARFALYTGVKLAKLGARIAELEDWQRRAAEELNNPCETCFDDDEPCERCQRVNQLISEVTP